MQHYYLFLFFGFSLQRSIRMPSWLKMCSHVGIASLSLGHFFPISQFFSSSDFTFINLLLSHYNDNITKSPVISRVQETLNLFRCANSSTNTKKNSNLLPVTCPLSPVSNAKSWFGNTEVLSWETSLYTKYLIKEEFKASGKKGFLALQF